MRRDSSTVSEPEKMACFQKDEIRTVLEEARGAKSEKPIEIYLNKILNIISNKGSLTILFIRIFIC